MQRNPYLRKQDIRMDGLKNQLIELPGFYPAAKNKLHQSIRNPKNKSLGWGIALCCPATLLRLRAHIIPY